MATFFRWYDKQQDNYSTGYLRGKDLSKGYTDVSALALSVSTPIGDGGISLGADLGICL